MYSSTTYKCFHWLYLYFQNQFWLCQSFVTSPHISDSPQSPARLGSIFLAFLALFVSTFSFLCLLLSNVSSAVNTAISPFDINWNSFMQLFYVMQRAYFEKRFPTIPADVKQFFLWACGGLNVSRFQLVRRISSKAIKRIQPKEKSISTRSAGAVLS